MTPGLRNLLLGLLGSLSILLTLYGGARYLMGVYLEWQITERVQALGYESDHQVEVRAYERGILSSKLNLIVDSPLMKGVLHVSVVHGPLFNRGSIGLADLVIDVPARAYLNTLQAIAGERVISRVLPQPSFAGGSLLPDGWLKARIFPSGLMSGRFELTDFEYRDDSGEVIQWQGFDAGFDALPDHGPVFVQASLTSFVLSDAKNRSLSFQNGTFDAEFSGWLNPDSNDTQTLFLGHTELMGTKGSLTVLDGLEVQQIVRPRSDWLREFDVAVPSGVYRARGAGNVPFEVSGRVQLNHLDAVEWDHLQTDLFTGSRDAVVWSALAASGATARMPHFSLMVGGHRGESFGDIRLLPLNADSEKPWASVSGKLFVEFERDALDLLVSWGVAPYFTGRMAAQREADPDVDRSDLLEADIAALVQSGRLRPSNGGRFSTLITFSGDGLGVNGRPIGAVD